jgi:hypothetical protein
MALLVLSLFFLSLSAGLSTDDASKAVPQEELDLSLRSDTCTYQYALLAKDEPISFLVFLASSFSPPRLTRL